LQYGEGYCRSRQVSGYPIEFVRELTRRVLTALIPERTAVLARRARSCGDHGGDHDLARTPALATMCTSWVRSCATVPMRRSEPTCRRSPPGELRLQSFGVTESTIGTDTTNWKTTAVRVGDNSSSTAVEGPDQPREHSDLMLLLAHDAAIGCARKTEAYRRSSSICASTGHGLDVRPINAMINHHSCELFFTNWGAGRKPAGCGRPRLSRHSRCMSRALLCIERRRWLLFHRQSRRVCKRRSYRSSIGKNHALPITLLYEPKRL
jgi:acyl-CoA dehydrogenase